MSMSKSEKILRRFVIGLFVFFMLAGIIFAMGVSGPGMPQGEKKLNVSCYFPLLNDVSQCAKGVTPPQE